MIGRRAAVGLSLLCALVFCAFAAQSASAKGITAFTCSESNSGGNKFDFSDAHCDKAVAEKTGKFGHVEIAQGQQTEITATNDKTKNATTEHTPLTFKTTFIGAKVEISCTKVHATETIQNVVDPKGVMQVEGKNFQFELKMCTVVKPAKCTLKEPIVLTGSSTTVETLGAGKNEMGVEFRPAGSNFAEITFQNKGEEKCALAGASLPIEGTAVGTGSIGSTEAAPSTGATLVFTEAMTKETLKFGTEGSFNGTLTVKMKLTKQEEEKGEDKQQAIIFTTTAT